MSAASKEQVGQYRIIRPLKSGGMADVFLAKKIGDLSSQSFVIKQISAGVDDKWYYSKLFIREAQLSLALHHPNIVRTFEMGTSEGTLYLVLEYIDGLNLSDIIRAVERKERLLPAIMVYYVLTEVALGLSYMHGELSLSRENPICIHRDLSPHNIMVSRTGDVKIIDFGIAKTRESEVLTQLGSVRGKYTYMSPEQIRGEPLAPSSDIFSLGIMCYELLAGKRFFGEQTELEVVRSLDSWSLSTLEQKLLDVGAEDAEILRQMLDPVPANRSSALRLKSIIETRMRTLDGNYSRRDFAESLVEFTAEIPSRSEALSTASSIAVGNLPSQITLYDVLMNEPKKSHGVLGFALLGLVAGVGLFFLKNADTTYVQQQDLASIEQPSRRSLLVHFRNFNGESMEISVNGSLIDSAIVKRGFRVYDGDAVMIRYYSNSQRQWLEREVLIDTSKPLDLNLDL